MKKHILALSVILIASACSQYDDSHLKEQLQNHEGRISTLESQYQQLQQNINSLFEALKALQSNDYVTNVAPIVYNGETLGYTITFSKSAPISIYNGSDGKDGTTPLIGVKQDTDNNWYWTLNGSWLLDLDGKKVRASGTDGSDGLNGDDGITPKVTIGDDGFWYLSVDNGATWTKLVKATGEDGDSFFRSVEDTSSAVILTLADGTVISLPKYQPVNIIFSGYDPNSSVFDYVQIHYEISGSSNSYEIDAISTNPFWHASVRQSSPTSGVITIEKESFADPDVKVMVFVTAESGESTTRILNFTEGVFTGDNTIFEVSSDGQTVTLNIETNTNYEICIPDEAKSWISLEGGTKATRMEAVSFKVEKNTGPSRQAEIDVIRQEEMPEGGIRVIGLYHISVVQEAAKVRIYMDFSVNTTKTLMDNNGIQVEEGEYVSVNGVNKDIRFDGGTPYVEADASAIGYDLYYPANAFRSVAHQASNDIQVTSYFSNNQDAFNYYCYGYTSGNQASPFTVCMNSLTGFCKLDVNSTVNLVASLESTTPISGEWQHSLDPYSYEISSSTANTSNEVVILNMSPQKSTYFLSLPALSYISSPVLRFYTQDGYLIKQRKSTISKQIAANVCYGLGTYIYSDTDAMPVSSVFDEAMPVNTLVRVNGKVVQVGRSGFVINDGSGENLSVYTSPTPTVAKNDIVQVDGKKNVYGGCMELSSPQVRSISKDITPATVSPILLSGSEIDNYTSVSSTYVQLVGTLSVEGRYYRLNMEGATKTVNINTQTDLSSYNGQTVRISGYFYGSQGNYFHLYFDKVDL